MSLSRCVFQCIYARECVCARACARVSRGQGALCTQKVTVTTDRNSPREKVDFTSQSTNNTFPPNNIYE